MYLAGLASALRRSSARFLGALRRRAVSRGAAGAALSLSALPFFPTGFPSCPASSLRGFRSTRKLATFHFTGAMRPGYKRFRPVAGPQVFAGCPVGFLSVRPRLLIPARAARRANSKRAKRCAAHSPCQGGFIPPLLHSTPVDVFIPSPALRPRPARRWSCGRRSRCRFSLSLSHVVPRLCAFRGIGGGGFSARLFGFALFHNARSLHPCGFCNA